MATLNDEEKTRYLDNPKFCPKCGSDRLGDDSEWPKLRSDGKAAVDAYCNSCGYKWIDIYQSKRTVSDGTKSIIAIEEAY